MERRAELQQKGELSPMGSFFYRAGNFQDETACPGCGCAPCAEGCPVGTAEAILSTQSAEGTMTICFECGVVVRGRQMRPDDHLEPCFSGKISATPDGKRFLDSFGRS